MHNQINSLTQREKEVLFLISQEFSTKEIATKLFLSKSTIESHRRTLLIKLNAKNTAGLMRRSFELGYLKVDTPEKKTILSVVI